DLPLFVEQIPAIIEFVEPSNVAIPFREQIRIIAQPEQEYHARYRADFDREKKRAPRYIRSGAKNFEYPTIEIPSKYCDPNSKLYIRVCLVTVPQTDRGIYYIHPYSLETPEPLTGDIIQNSEDNAIYFPITQTDLNSGGIK
ncbi:unnamed protein product, partial [Didymodactylos carnosus]